METSSALRAAVSVAVGEPATALSEVRREPLEYDAFLSHRTVNRLRGQATVDGGSVPWSLVEKRTEGSALASPYLQDNARRELAAYTSGILDAIAPHLRAPRAWGTRLEPDGAITLWLEEIRHEGPRPLSAEAILVAARDLGGLSGRWFGRELREPWHLHGWIDRHGQSAAVADGRATLRRAHPSAVARLGRRLGLVERLILGQPRVREVLEALPQTLCHHDAVGANVFTTDANTVLIDWESVGPGAVGADLASLLFSSVRRGDASAEVVIPVVDDALLAYADGMRAEGAAIDGAGVRQGFDAAIALRWKLAVDVVAGIGNGGDVRRGSLPDEASEVAMDQLVSLVDLLLASAARVLD